MRTKRIELIQQFINEKKSVSIDELCEHFQVSKNTVRRDIDTLVKSNLVTKVHGGVTALEDSSIVPELIPYEKRHIVALDEKDTICRLAADCIENGDIIFIDTGTTCLNIVDYISHKKCTILTNSLQVCLKSVPYPNLTVIVLSGTLKRETFSFVGNTVTDYIKMYNIKKAFMACSGLSVENGVTNASTEEYLIKKVVTENCHMLYLLADHSKFDHFALMTYCSISQLDYLITNKEVPTRYLESFASNNVSVITP